MKKLLVVLLALTFVVAMASVTLAVVTSSVDGKVELTLDNTNQLGGSVDGKLSFDLQKDYGEGYSAGLKIKIAPNDADEVTYDGAGWIEMKKEVYTVTLKTDINANVGNDLSGFCDLTSGPGLQVVYTGMENFTLTAVVNEKDLLYNYNFKGVYAADPLTVGLAYQSNTVVDGAPAAVNDALGVWGSYKIGDSLTVGAEYVSRPNITADGATSMLVKASYVADALTVNGSFTTKTLGFCVKDPAKYVADADKYSMAEVFDYSPLFDASLIKVDASYKISDAFSVNGNVQMISGEILGLPIETNNMSYKLGATYVVSDKLSTEAWYKAIGTEDVMSQIGVKATYTFVAGLVGSLELDSNSVTGSDATNAYTAKITATL